MYPVDLSQFQFVRYRRKSSEDEDRQVASLGDQGVALDEVMARFRIAPSQIAADFTESKSAKLSNTRPEFKAMLDMIASGGADAILSWHPDRLSRNLGDIDSLIQLLEANKLKVIVTPQYVFGNTPLEKYILISECTRAKLENDNRGVNVRRGLQSKVRRGWRPGAAPVGYLNDTSGLKGERKIVCDPDRFDKVQHLLRMFLTGGYSVRQLRDAAEHTLLLSTRRSRRQGNRPLSLSHVYAILTNPFYCGKFWWHTEGGPEKDLRDGAHTAMISESEYWNIQALLGRPIRQRPKSKCFAYGGLMRCGECGAAITAEEKWQIICGECKNKFASQDKKRCPRCNTSVAELRSKKLLHYTYYRCTKHKGRCSQRSIREEQLEKQVDQILTRFQIGEKYVRWALETLIAQVTTEAPGKRSSESQLNRERTKLKEELAELNRFIIKQEISGWNLMSREEALNEKERIVERLKKVEQRQQAPAKDGIEETVTALDYASHARLWLKEGTLEQKHRILAQLGSNLILKDKKLTPDLQYPLIEIERMIEIAPEIISGFEPSISKGKPRLPEGFAAKIPALRRRLNAVRTYFQRTQAPFWRPQSKDAGTR